MKISGNAQILYAGATLCQVYGKAEQAAQQVTQNIANIIRKKTKSGQPAVLGLATGSTPVLVYRELIRLHREEGLSFQNVHSFNLDEYYGLAADHAESYGHYMKTQLFDHIDIPDDQTHLPDGTVPRENLASSCEAYEKMITDLGGLDFQILGIGQTGHIGFNEPGSPKQSRTRMITLDRMTRLDAARDFLGLENVPRFAITMGVGSILEAREIALLAWGKSKAAIIRRALEEPPNEEVSASLLQGHANLTCYFDESAASELSSMRFPWTVGSKKWTKTMIKRAIHSVALQEKKPLLKLLDRDYQLHGLEELLSLKGPAYDLNIRAFDETQATITGWPGGKPSADDRKRPVPSVPERKRIVVLCAEPGAESACLGATVNRLQVQGHQIQLVFVTSGSKVIKGDSLNRFKSLLKMLENMNGSFSPSLEKIGTQPESKKLLSRHQSLLAVERLGLTEAPVFLDLPFYEAGTYRKFQPQEEDIQKLADYMNELAPHQIYTTGKMADPSSLEGVCWQMFETSREKWGSWNDACQVWLFREEGKSWESHEIDMAVPVSPDELAMKEAAMQEYPYDLFQAGLNGAVKVAEDYDLLGLPEYEAIEAFQLYKPELKR